MPTLFELANLCDAVYSDMSFKPITSKHSTVVWKRIQRWSDGNFFAALYEKSATNKVLAYRGTDDAIDVLKDDRNIASGQVPPSATAAINVAGSMAKGNVLLTGHSLGGALAIIAAGRFGLPAVTFNAPGVMNACIAANAFSSATQDGLTGLLMLVQRCVGGIRIRDIRIDGDPVSSKLTSLLSYSFQSGSTAVYDAPQCGIDLACRHGIKTCIDVLRNRPDGFQEIKI